MADRNDQDAPDPPAGSADVGEASEEVPSEYPRLVANVPDDQMFSWESQVRQYPATGPPGISYIRVEPQAGLFVDCLLFRDERGELVGILNRYPMAIPPYEREGDGNLWVHPERRRQGIGTALFAEAFIRWSTSPPTVVDEPKLTQAGVQLLQGMDEKTTMVRRVLPTPRKVVYDAWCDAQGLRTWLCPLPSRATRVQIDPEAGGSLQIDIETDGHARRVTGRYLILERPRGLVFTWRCSTWEPTTLESVVAIQMEPEARERTLMVLRHGRLPDALIDAYRADWGVVAGQLEGWLRR